MFHYDQELKLDEHTLYVNADLRYEDVGIFQENICLTDYKIDCVEVCRGKKYREIKPTEKLANRIIDEIDEQLRDTAW